MIHSIGHRRHPLGQVLGWGHGISDAVAAHSLMVDGLDRELVLGAGSRLLA